jgi:hypothetical protein
MEFHRSADDRPDRRVQSGAVAAAGQDTDRLRRSRVARHGLPLARPRPARRTAEPLHILTILSGFCYTLIERHHADRRDMPTATMDLNIEATKAKLEMLRGEHRDLDEVIARLAEKAPFNLLQLQRLKKRKLLLKDQITKLESQLLPDIIA